MPFIFKSEGHSEGNLTLLDVHLLVSLFFVIATMIEFAVVLMISRMIDCPSEQKIPSNGKKRTRKLSTSRKSSISHKGSPTDTNRSQSILNLHREAICSHQGRKISTTNQVDITAFVVFFLSCLMFNCIYMANCI